MLASGCLRTRIWTRSKQQQLQKGLWGCLFSVTILKMRGFCLATFQCLISSHLQGLMHHHLYCWMLEIMTQMTCWQFKWKCLILKLSFVCHFTFFCKFFISASFLLVKVNFWNDPPHSNIALMGKLVSTYVIFTTVAGLRTILKCKCRGWQIQEKTQYCLQNTHTNTQAALADWRDDTTLFTELLKGHSRSADSAIVDDWKNNSLLQEIKNLNYVTYVKVMRHVYFQSTI